MILHIVRHAEAIERTQDVPEEHRFLTTRGRKRFRKIAKSLRKMGIKPDVILTSPLVRAVQTAEILAQALKHKGDLTLTPLLGPGFRPEALDKLLSSYPQAQEIAIVGHEPDLGLLARVLLGTDADCTLRKGAVISFKKVTEHETGAEFMQLVEGGGKIITSRGKALGRLLNG